VASSTPYNVSVGGTDFGDSYAGTNSTYWRCTNSSTYESALSYIPRFPGTIPAPARCLRRSKALAKLTDRVDSATAARRRKRISDHGVGQRRAERLRHRVVPSGVVGGTCAGWPKPSWQSLVGNPSDGVRDIPDVSLFAANGVWGHYYPFCFSDPEALSLHGHARYLGGSGRHVVLLTDHGRHSGPGEPETGERQGNPNPVYYSLAATEYGSQRRHSSCNSTLGNRRRQLVHFL
jgi:hypothetical protein